MSEFTVQPLLQTPLVAAHDVHCRGACRHRKLAHAYAIALEGIGPALTRSRVPVRIVWGEADTIFAVAKADFLDRAFGHSLGVRRLAGSKLFWPEERPEVIAEEARRLWAASDRPA